MLKRLLLTKQFCVFSLRAVQWGNKVPLTL